MCVPTWLTPGIAASSRCSAPTIRRSSGSEVPGFVMTVAEEVPLLELGNQGLTEERHHGDPRQHGEAGQQIRPPRPVDDSREQADVAALQPTRERSVATVERRPAEEDQAQRGRDRERDDERREHREAVREDERPEERAGQALEEEDGQERGDDDQRRVDDRAPNLERGLEDDPRLRLRAVLCSVLAQASPDVLDVDDRVVDDHPERDHEPREDHHVDRLAPRVEDQSGGDERQRDRDDADQRRPPLEEERAEDEDDEQRPDQQRDREVVDRRVDEVGGAEDVGVELDAGKARLHLVDRRLHTVGDVERVPPRVLLDDQQQAGTAVDDCVAGERHACRRRPSPRRPGEPSWPPPRRSQPERGRSASRSAGRAGRPAAGSACR